MTVGPGARANPFSACRVGPDALAFLSCPGTPDVETAWRRLVEAGFVGQIVGPKGTGKSTLLHHLSCRARAEGLQVVGPEEAAGPCDGRRLVVVDNPERLGRPRWWALRARVAMRGHGLLVAAHEDRGLPEVARLHVDPELAMRIVERLLEGWPADPVVPAGVGALLDASGGNLRKVLQALYDRWEQQGGERANGDPAC